MTTTMTRSQTFTWFNKARACNEFSSHIINKALSLAMRNEARPYNTTVKFCNCQAGQRGQMCSHRVLKMMEYKASKKEQPQPRPERPTTVYMETDNGDLLVAEKIGGSNYNLHIFPDQHSFTRWNKHYPHGILVRPGQLQYGTKKFEFTHDFDGSIL